MPAAMDSIVAASAVMPPGDDWARAKLLWLKASVHLDLNEISPAVATLEEVIAILVDIHPGEAALATCELVRVFLHQGQGEAAYKAAISMRAFVEPFRYNRIISAAIGDLLRSGQKGLTLALVKRVMKQIEGERQDCQSWHSLRKVPI